MKIIPVCTFLISFFLVLSCSSKEQEKHKTEADQTVQNTLKEIPKQKTSTANIVTANNQALPMEKRGGEFTLYGKDGAVSLSDYKGKVVAIYFGYTQCPDVCPTNLSFMGAAFKKLPENELENTQGIFISVDPGRDTPEHLAEYTQYFHPKIIGVSGTPKMIDPIISAYGAFYEKISYSNSALMYGISHTSETYIVDKKGKLSAILPHAAPADDIVKAIKTALSSD